MNRNHGNQDWIFRDKKDYSPIFVDMIDDYNQSIDGYVLDDNLSGYSVKSLDENITKFRTIKDVKTYIKGNKPNGVTDELIDKYLESYKDYM